MDVHDEDINKNFYSPYEMKILFHMGCFIFDYLLY
jgi:hypothetical protein